MIDTKAAGELRNHIEMEVLDRVTRNEMLDLLDRLTAPRTYAAGGVVREWVNGRAERVRFLYNQSGLLTLERQPKGFQRPFWEVVTMNTKTREALAGGLGIPAQLTLPKPQRPTWGPESDPITEEEAKRLQNGARVLAAKVHGSDLRWVGLSPWNHPWAVVMGHPGGLFEVYLPDVRPADLDTARQLGRETAEGTEA